MTLLTYAVDLGTTNLKVVLYDEQVRCLAVAREPMRYRREDDRVEFDAEQVFDAVLRLIRSCAVQAGLDGHSGPAQIAVTGQAESLVLVDADGLPVAPGISWMDERSHLESAEIAERFDPEWAFAVTGEPEPVPTWPATKLRWLAHHRPELLGRGHRVSMIKDYLLLRLTGNFVGEETTRGFTYLYDVSRRAYWEEMVDFCGIRLGALPEVVPAGTDLGPVRAGVAGALPPASSYTVNAGALDHFCAMLGTGSYRAGAVSASAGTVLSLSLLASGWQFDPGMKVSFHAGLRPGEVVLFTCADSGGVSLDWFQQNISAGVTYDALERELSERTHQDAPLFLPYLTGVNPPDFDPAARGAFLNLQLRHDRVDLAYAVMEGVAHLLHRNLLHLADHGQPADAIVSAGGGTASRFWNQLKADACGLDLHVPEEPEAACRGAALLALTAAGALDAFDDTDPPHRPAATTYRPRETDARSIRYQAFDAALRQLSGRDGRTPIKERGQDR